MGKGRWKDRASIAFTGAEELNSLTYVDYLKRLEELALNMFEWKNLPYDIDERFLELSLFGTGMAVFFYEEVMERYLALNVLIGGNLDVYRVPKTRRAYAVNGYNKELSDKDSVIIFNNYLREPSFLTVQLYARRLYEVERAIDVNVKAQKTPLVILCDEAQRLTVKNMYAQYDGNEPFIFGAKTLDMVKMEAIKTDAPFVADKLTDLKHQYWNEALTFLGIDNANTDKKERLVTPEVTSNLGAVQAQRLTRLNMRRRACEQINKMFGLDIWVDFREEVVNAVKEVDESEQVHGGTEVVTRDTIQSETE